MNLMPGPPDPPAAATPSPHRNVAVIGKAVDVLEALAHANGCIGLSQLARSTELPKSTVQRLCLSLADSGLIERHADGWVLGGKLFELGQRVPSRRRLRDGTLPFLNDLHRDTGHTVHLAAVERDHVVYVEKVEGPHTAPTPSEIAGHVPLHCTATGKCFLAFAEDELRERVFAHPLDQRTRHTIVDPEVLRTHLDEVRASGVAIEREEYVEGFVSVAAPVFGILGSPLGAIAATSTIDRVDIGRTRRRVAHAATEATRRFGGRPLRS